MTEEEIRAYAEKHFCPDCVSITLHHNPMEGWEWEVDDCSLEHTVTGSDLTEALDRAAAHRAAWLEEAHDRS